MILQSVPAGSWSSPALAIWRALASVSLSSPGKLERLSGESKALGRLIEEKSAELALEKVYSVKLEGLRKIYGTLMEEEAKLVSALEQLELQQMRTENRELEMLSTASVPQSPIQPKVRLIVALSAVVALFSGIFLSFVIESVRNIRSKTEEILTDPNAG